MDLSVFASDWTIIYLLAGLAENWPGLILTGVFLALCRSSDVAWAEATAYACYFFAGLVVAYLHLRIVFGIPLGEYGLSGYGAVVVVALLYVVALAATYRQPRKSAALIVLAGLTVVLAALQFSEPQARILNTYARGYAVVCIIVPIGFLIRAFWSARQSLR